MSNFIYLTNPRQCPHCRAKFSNALNGNCANCGTRLFRNTDYSFESFEEQTGIVVWWAFDRTHGWKYRDHFMIQDAKPVHRHYEQEKISPTYGRQTTPAEVARRGGKLKRQIRREK